MTPDRYLIDEVAAQTDVALEKLEEWVRLGLLSADAGGRLSLDDIERARLLRAVTERGVEAGDIAAYVEGEGDILARFVDFIEARDAPYSVEQAAQLAGLDPALVDELWKASGFGAQRRLSVEDVESFRGVAAALEAGLPPDAMRQLARVYADALGRVADAEVRLFHFHVHERLRAAGASGAALDDATESATRALRSLIEPAVLYYHRKAWDRAVREDLGLHLADDVCPHRAQAGALRLAVLFVDLASFTPMTEAMGDDAAATVLDRFSQLVREAAAHCSGRVVKQIGDEFMLVFPTAHAAVTCGIDVADLVGREPRFPSLRLGAHVGTALYREADYLGSAVNMAARVGAAAGRGEFLVTEDVREECGEIPVDWEPLGPRRLKGLAEPLNLYAVRHRRDQQSRRTDPVCGMQLDGSLSHPSVTWRGGLVQFCSESCREQFEAAPHLYTLTPP